MRLTAVTALCAGMAAATAGTASAASTYITEQVQFLAAHQLSDGAILGPYNDEIVPYYANMAAIGLARANTAAGNAIVCKWMQWYLRHLNAKDVNGLADTVYDYSYDASTGAETPKDTYDSVDSYAATAISLAYTGYLTGDSQITSLVSGHIASYEAIANLDDYPAPTGVRQPDGLTVASPGKAAYTMDNAEVAGGLSDFSRLEALLKRSSQSTYYGQWSATSVQAITKSSAHGGLWNTANNNWDWALGSPSNPKATFYPDATAQLWPVLFGVVTPGSSQATAAWQAFTSAYPSWDADKIPDTFPWAVMARAAQRMGDPGANTLLSTLESNYAPGWAFPWYDDEAGWFLLALTGTSP